jgi:hypothetical protein
VVKGVEGAEEGFYQRVELYGMISDSGEFETFEGWR